MANFDPKHSDDLAILCQNGPQCAKNKLIINIVEEKNPANEDGYTPLFIAALMGHFEICKLIIDNMEDKNPKTNSG